MNASILLGVMPTPFLSVMFWAVLLVLVLYGARMPLHQAIEALFTALWRALRLATRAVQRGEAQLKARNREVLLEAGRETCERHIEREFERVDVAVRRELAEYPSLQRKLSEAITAIEEDYQKSASVPPSPPGWVAAVEAVANIPARQEPVVGEILDNIHDSISKAEQQALETYRESCATRHGLLKRAMPFWREALTALGRMDKNVAGLLDRTHAIDRHMANYEEMVRGSDRVVRTLSSSSLTQFVISGLVMLIAIGGAFINFNLIARPMSEMVGGTNMIAGWAVADIAALVIILVEVSMGIFLMESLRITRLFPVIAALHDRMRVRMVWVSFIILLSLACVEAGLAFMREMLMQDELATAAMLRGGAGDVASTPAAHFWITTVAQMGMGFILPFALTFVAIPLETFLHSARTVAGLVGVGLLRSLAVCLRALAAVSQGMGKMFINFYDALIFIPLHLEQTLRRRNGSATKEGVA